MLCIPTALALLWANSPWGESYSLFWETPLTVQFASHKLTVSLAHLINDGLMTLFFLLVGLEIKRELLVGELASPRKAALPVFAALGGVVVPALIYGQLNPAGPAARGWGIPMATDIAFAMGTLTLLTAIQKPVPAPIKVFLLAVAIIDDLVAVLVIAIFYTPQLHVPALAGVAGLFAVLVTFNAAGMRRLAPYLLCGLALWGAMLASGLHATLAGVLLAFTLPARDETASADGFHRPSPLTRLEHALPLPVNWMILPLFALANAGVSLRSGSLDATQHSIAWGVLLGLLIGKPVGVTLASLMAVGLNLGQLPGHTHRTQLVGAAVLCGIGFTMSLFVANLAFPNLPPAPSPSLAAAKLGIFAASLLSAVLGGTLMSLKTNKTQ